MPEKLSFTINLDVPIPVYVQIQNQVQFSIAAGRLKTGDLLPSIREAAVMVKVNPNTIAKAYRDLAVLGIIETRRGVGGMVSDKAPKLCAVRVKGMVLAHLKEAVAECMAAGLDQGEIDKTVKDAVKSKAAPYHK